MRWNGDATGTSSVYRAYAELKSEAQLNYMGYVWWLLEPLLNTILFYVIMARRPLSR